MQYCNNNNLSSPDLKLHIIPSFLAELKPNEKRKQVINRGGKKMLRRESLDRSRESRYCKKKKRACEDRVLEVVMKRKIIVCKVKFLS